MKIRKATISDVPRLIDLLHQVNMVHHRLRPDLFKPNTTKYSETDLCDLIMSDTSPIFVYEDVRVVGYAFCSLREVSNDMLLNDNKTLYVDDLCVDESVRGAHVGKALFDHVRQYAHAVGCSSITLNVWAGNEAAIAFYEKMGMHVKKMEMEYLL